MLKVPVIKNNLNKALKLFKRKFKNTGVLKELRERQSYEKPSEKKRRKRKENIANCKKEKKKLERLRGY